MKIANQPSPQVAAFHSNDNEANLAQDKTSEIDSHLEITNNTASTSGELTPRNLNAAYKSDGSISHHSLGKVLEAVISDADQHAVNLGFPSSQFAYSGIKALKKLHSKIDQLKNTNPNRSMGVYESLKLASRQFSYAAKFSNGVDAERLQALENLLLQMARVEFYQRNIGLYDKEADAAAASVLERNPNFDNVINSQVEDTTTASVSGGASFGVAAGTSGAGATISVTGGYAHTDLAVAVHDLDGDNILIDGSQNSVSVGARAGAGIIAAAAGFGGSISVKEMHAQVIETPSLRDGFRKKTQADRDGHPGESAAKVTIRPFTGHGIAGAVNATGHNIKAGARRAINAIRTATSKDVSRDPIEVQTKIDSSKRANIGAAWPPSKAIGSASQLFGKITKKMMGASMPEKGARYLTTEKLQKGAAPEILPDYAEREFFSPLLKSRLKDAYGDMPSRSKPGGYDASVLRGYWEEVKVQAGLDMKTAVIAPATAATGEISIAMSGSGTLGARRLPAQLFIAPHNMVDKSLVGDRAVGQMEELRASSTHKDYLAYSESLPTVNIERLNVMKSDVDTFEKASNRLLSGTAIAISKDGTIEKSTRIVDGALKEMAEKFFPQLDSRPLIDEGRKNPEKFISRCWNALSLGVIPLTTKDVQVEDATLFKDNLNNLKKRVENPNILMPADRLHQNSILPATGELERHRIELKTNVNIPIPLIYGAGITNASVGVTMTHDTVDSHPNPVRNGKFLQFDIDLSGIPPVPIAIDKIIAAVSQLPLREDIRKNIGGLSLGLSIPNVAKFTIGEGKGAGSPDTLGITGGLSFNGGNKITVMLHKPSYNEKTMKVSGTDSSKSQGQWRPLFVQTAMTTSTDARFGVNINIAKGAGGTISAGLSSSNGEAIPTITKLYPEPSIQLLQYGTFKEQMRRLGLFDTSGEFTPCIPKGTDGMSKSDTSSLTELIGQKYFAQNCLPEVVASLLAIRKDADEGGGANAIAADDFAVLSRQEFSKAAFQDYLNDPNAPPVAVVAAALEVASQATKGLSAADRFSYFTDGKHHEGLLIMKEYVRGMNALNQMKVNAFFQPGQDIHAPFSVKELNKEMKLQLNKISSETVS